MSNHHGDANKMVDTPRMKAAQMAAIEHGTGDVYRVGCDIERELNAANYEVQHLREAYIQLQEGNERQRQRIKRLEEAGDALANTQTYDLLETVNWRKSKEAKP